MKDVSDISTWLDVATKILSEADIPSARLDAELIMTHTLRKNRTYLHAHGDDKIDQRYLDILDTRLALRLDRVPIAYIVGHKEFYGRRFRVTPATLIPRPESETMISLLIESTQQLELPILATAPRLVDVGTGSGCLGITAKLEVPELDVTLTDISRHALSVAEANAKQLGANVKTMRSSLLQSYPFKADYILANLPYVNASWEVSPETAHEPEVALYADNSGLSLINTLLEEAPKRLTPTGMLYIEADSRQHSAITDHASSQGLKLHTSRGLILVFTLS